MILSQEVSKLIGDVDRMFISFVGDQGAYHEAPTLQCVPYQVAAFSGRLDETTERELIPLLVNEMERMFKHCRNEGAVRIAWRLGWRMELQKVHYCEHGGDLLRLYTRLALFTERWAPVNVPTWFDTDIGSILTAEQLRDRTT